MAQRKFLSSDTSEWSARYGSGGAGAFTSSGNIADSARSGYVNTTFAGTAGSTGTVGSATGLAIGDLVVLHQSRNGGAGAGEYELAEITNISGTTITFKDNLMNTYATTGQLYRFPQNTDITINHTITGVAWDGTKGGIMGFMANGTFSGSGTLDLNSVGYRGGVGQSGTDASGEQGEGTLAAHGTISSSANGNGGGGVAGSGTGDGGSAGAGGGNGGTGGNGAGGQQKNPGTGGGTAGNAGLTLMVFGGGGGGGGAGRNGSNNGGDGGIGGGILIIIAKTIDLSSMTIVRANGAAGGTGANNSAGAGGGAGGSILLKGQTVNIGTAKVEAKGGAGGTGASGNSSGGTAGTTGNGGNGNNQDLGHGSGGGGGSCGRIHVDYSKSLTGSSTPTVDSTQDAILADKGGMWFGIL